MSLDIVARGLAKKAQSSSANIPDVTKSNDNLALYLRGDGVTDDSVRLHIENGVTKLQKLIDGNWQNSSFQSGSSTVYFGNDVSAGSSGHHLTVGSKSTGGKYLVVQIPFDNNGTQEIGTPILQPKEIRSIQQSDDSGEWVGTKLRYTRTITINQVFDRIYYKIGSVTATKSIRTRLYRDVEDFDHCFYDEGFSSNVYNPINTEINFNMRQDVGYSEGMNLIVVHESEAPFSLKMNAAGTHPWVAIDRWLEHHEYIPHWNTWEAKNWNVSEAIVQGGVLYICQVTGEQTVSFDNNLSKWKKLEDVLSEIGGNTDKELESGLGVDAGSLTDVYSSSSSQLDGSSINDTNIDNLYIMNGGNLDKSADFIFDIDGGTW